MSNRTINKNVTCPVCNKPGATLHEYDYIQHGSDEAIYRTLVLDCETGCRPTEAQLTELNAVSV